LFKANYQASENSGLTSGILFIFKAVGISYIISIALLFVAALIATYQSMSNVGICVLANVVTAIGTIISGFIAGRHFDSKGLLYGAGCGAVYTIILCIFGNIISGNINLGASFLTAFLIGVLCGAVGGIAGINTKKKRRR
jgi:putative membrane protein (TIGR04086 family)